MGRKHSIRQAWFVWSGVTLGAAVLAASVQTPPQTPPPQPPSAQKPAPPQDPQTTPIFRATSDVVAVDVSVIDNEGRPIRGLTPADFAIKVDGTPRNILSAEFISQTAAPSGNQPEEYSTNEEIMGGRLIMLVIDQGNISQGDGRPVLNSAKNFLATLNKSDRVGLAVIPGPVGRIDFTNRHALVQERLGRVAGLAGRPFRNFRVGIAETLAVERGDQLRFREIFDRECANESDPDRRAVCERNLREELRGMGQAIRQQTNTSLMAFRSLMVQLAKIEGPKTLILISEGLVIGRDLGSISWVPSLAGSARASVYALRMVPDVFDASHMKISPTWSEDRELQVDGLEHLVRAARGALFTIGPNADAAFGRLALELTGYYLLGFEPVGTDRDGKAHQINVDVKRRGVTVRARREFSAGSATLAINRKDEEAITDTLNTPLIATDLRVKVTTFSYEDAATGKLKLLVSADVAESPDDAPVTAAGFILTNEQGRVAASSYDPTPAAPVDERKVRHYLGAAVVDPGTYLLKFAVRDLQGRVGSVEHIVKARLTTAGQLTVGDLLLSEITGDQQGAIRPVVDPALRFSEVVGYLELYSKNADQLDKAAVKLEVAAEPNAPPLVHAPAQVAETKSPSRRIVQGSLNLAALPPGNYVARAIVSVGDRPVARITRPFYLSATAVARANATPGKSTPSPSARPGSFDRGDVLHTDVVRAYMDRLIKIEADMPQVVTTAVGHARDGRYDRAFDEVQRLANDRLSVAFLRGLGLFQRGDIEAAAVAFRESLRLSADFMPAAVYLGACYAAGGRDQEAVGAWQTAMVSEEETPIVHALLADALVPIGEPEQAAEALHEAVKLFPDDDRFKRRLGIAYAAAGKGVDALANLDPYLAKHPTDLDALFLAMRLIYEAGARSRPLASVADDLQRFDRYARAYAAANGPQQQMVAQWHRYLSQQR